MSAERLPRTQAPKLLLVRGGRDDEGGGRDDWDDFCHRIGWQTSSPEPDADFERRIAEGLFTKPVAPSNVVDIDSMRTARKAPRDVERALHEMLSRALSEDAPPSFVGRTARRQDVHEGSWDDEDKESSAIRKRVFGAGQSPLLVAPEAEEDGSVRGMETAAMADVTSSLRRGRPLRTGALVGAAAVMLAVAAAALLVVAKAGVFSDGSRAASIRRGGVTHEIAADPSVIRGDGDGANKASPAVTEPSDTTETARPEGPDPRVKAPKDGKSAPPGMRVARRFKGTYRRGQTATLTTDRSADKEFAGSEGAVADASSIGTLETLETPQVGARPGFASLRSPLTGFLDRRAAFASDSAPSESVSRWGVSPAGASPSASPAGVSPAPKLTLPGVDGAVSTPVVASAWSGPESPSVAPSAEKNTADPPRPASVTWSLSGAKDRWVGAALAPSPKELSAANVGVMVELDLGRALDRL